MSKSTNEYTLILKTSKDKEWVEDVIRRIVSTYNDPSYRGMYWTPPIEEFKIKEKGEIK